MEQATDELVKEVMERLTARKLTIATAESCTGGMVASTLINYSGASATFVDGFITYTNESKSRLLDVSCDTLNEYGAVSSQTAAEMCLGTAKVSGTDIGLSTTGIAGPNGGTEDKPVGLVYIGVAYKGEAYTQRLQLSGDRLEIRSKAVCMVIQMLNKILIDTEV
jgi:nicotinamide-nucleotide amidase